MNCELRIYNEIQISGLLPLVSCLRPPFPCLRTLADDFFCEDKYFCCNMQKKLFFAYIFRKRCIFAAEIEFLYKKVVYERVSTANDYAYN